MLLLSIVTLSCGGPSISLIEPLFISVPFVFSFRVPGLGLWGGRTDVRPPPPSLTRIKAISILQEAIQTMTKVIKKADYDGATKR